ncbi:hypothetical protein TNCV_976351 [Trichonephila clavipes]|nr:hypothetical protein TNCV_976351 [Trichonephila clavipes]
MPKRTGHIIELYPVTVTYLFIPPHQWRNREHLGHLESHVLGAQATRVLLAKNLVILNLCQVTRVTPELESLLQTTFLISKDACDSKEYQTAVLEDSSSSLTILLRMVIGLHVTKKTDNDSSAQKTSFANRSGKAKGEKGLILFSQ